MNSNLTSMTFWSPGKSYYERKRRFGKRAARNVMRNKMSKKSRKKNR